MKRAPRVVLCGGLEPTGRAGLLADEAAARALGAVPVLIPTALTAQGVRTFHAEPVRTPALEALLRASAEHGRTHAAKLGMVPARAQLAVLRRHLATVRPRWVVVDPVVRSSDGRQLSTLRPADYLGLADGRVVLTPNAGEAGWLLGWAAPPAGVGEAMRAGAELVARGFGAVVVKGGHLRGPPVDVLVTRDGATLFEGRRVRRTGEHRGTGCRFGAALASALAGGAALDAAVELARGHVRKFLERRMLNDDQS